MKLTISGKTYDILKAIAQVWLPAAGTLYFTLAQIWHLPGAEEVTASVVALDTFLGVGLHLSSATYPKDGAISFVHPETGNPRMVLNIDTDPNDLKKRKTAVFSVDGVSRPMPQPPTETEFSEDTPK